MDQINEIQYAIDNSKINVWNSIIAENTKEHLMLEQYLMSNEWEITQEGDLPIRIWQLLKKTSKATSGITDHVINLLQGVFHVHKKNKSGSTKTPNAIASEIVPDSSLPKEMQEAEKNLKTPFKGDENIALTATPLFIKEISEDESLYIGLVGVNYTKNEKGDLKHVSNSNGISGLEDNTIIYKNMCYYIKHPEALENLEKIVEKATSIIDSENNINEEELRDDIERTIKRSHMFGRDFNAGGTKITMKELVKFSSKINQLTNAMDKFQNANNSIKHLSGDTIRSLNALVRELETTQHGLNGLSNEVGKVYMIKAQYVNSIKDKNNLAKFVEDCIDAGVPPKFIAYNTWLIANEEIRGDKTDFKKVPMGQTRMVFFPKDKKIITKIAFSGRGLTSNKNEVRMSEFIERSGEEDIAKMCAKITGKYGKDDAVIDMERIVDRSSKHPNPKLLKAVKDTLKDFTARHPELRLVVTDINDGNIMWSSDRRCWVCIDYGLGQRDSTKEEKLQERANQKQDEYKKQTGKDDIKNVTLSDDKQKPDKTNNSEEVEDNE